MEAINFTMEIDIDEVKKLVYSDEFSEFLFSHSTNFSTAAYIMQLCFDGVDHLEEIHSELAASLDNAE